MDLDQKHDVQHIEVNFFDGLKNVEIANNTDIGYPELCSNNASKVVFQKDYRMFMNNQGELEIVDLKDYHVCNSDHFCIENLDPEVSISS